MAVFQNRPYERHMVSNIPTLLQAGLTLADLGVGQIGIFDAKTNLSVTAPTYAVNKAIYIAQGTPDHSNFPEGAGVPNVYRKTHTIAGKKIQKLYGKKANAGQVEIVTLGNTGIAGDTKTLSAKPGQTFYYYVRLTGDPIFNLNPDKSKGVIITGAVQMPCADECSDNCGTVDCKTIVDKVVADYNTKLLPGGAKASTYVEMTPVLNCATAASLETVSFYKSTLTIPSCNAYTGYQLGQVQATVPGFVVTQGETVNGYTTYETLFQADSSADCPSLADFEIPAGSVADSCDTCPAGFSHTDAKDEWTIKQTVAGTAPTVTGGTVTLLNTDASVNIKTYTVTTSVGLYADAAAVEAAAANFIAGSVAFVGVQSGFCVAGSPATFEWSACEPACAKVKVSFELFIRGNTCDESFLTEIQTAYASILADGPSSVTEDASGACGFKYTLVALSDNCVSEGCAPEDVKFPVLADFHGVAWTALSLAQPSGCYCGVQLKSVYVPRVTREATFDQFAYQTDFVHIEISSHNPDWRSTDLCETDPIATRVQNGAYPNGAGQAVARLEKADRMYDMDYFYMSPVLREAFDFYFETNFTQYYDQVGVEYAFTYSSNNGFGQTDTDVYIQNFWLPTTQATALVNALNGYAASALIDVDPIVL